MHNKYQNHTYCFQYVYMHFLSSLRKIKAAPIFHQQKYKFFTYPILGIRLFSMDNGNALLGYKASVEKIELLPANSASSSTGQHFR